MLLNLLILAWALRAPPPLVALQQRCLPPIACAHDEQQQPAPATPATDDDVDPPLPAMEASPSSMLPTDLGPLPPVGETLRQRDPASVGVVSLDLDRPLSIPLVDPQSTFVGLFRQCTPYIKMHQDSTMVIHVSSEVLENDSLFDQLMEEVAVLALLGVRPVLLVGVRSQIEAGLRRQGLPGTSEDEEVRVTDEPTMRVVQEVCGFMRSRVEGALARGRSRSGPGGNVGVDVVGGNFFYTAQPVGVRDGKDYGYTGEVRSVDVDKVTQHLNNGEIVLMTALGYSASGTVFNVRTEEVATAVATALAASKLIYVTPERLVGARGGASSCVAANDDEPSTAFVCSQPSDGASVEVDGDLPVVQSLRLAEAKTLITYYEQKPPATYDAPACTGRMLMLCRNCVRALELGVLRTHILPPTSGALIQELYTTDGIGTLISRDVYDGIRLATAADVPKIQRLIEPLEASGVLIKRPPDVLARDVDSGYYYVHTRDDTMLACAQLKRYSDTHAELACLVVARAYRRQGCGDAMLSFLERTANAAGVSNVFALSTHTMQWFVERGFGQVELEQLPASRVAIYDRSRGSKIYMKRLSSPRLIDAEELFWTELARDGEEASKANGNRGRR